jgi:septal ring factor EnvC (AmiA/AmiB activator)
LLKTELLPIRDELLASQTLVHKLEYEIEANKRNEKAKMSALTENYASLQAMHREKCREVEDLLATQSKFDQRLFELEKGRDNFREQYLETREANKQLSMQLKVAQKQLNA